MAGSRLSQLFSVRLLVTLAVVAAAIALPASAQATGYVQAPNGQPTVDSLTDGSVPAPWNTSQGVTSFNGLAISAYPTADLLPSFSFAGESSSSTPAVSGTGAPQEPNVAVYPAASGDEPFPSGFAGTPGPLSGFCGASYSDSWDTSNTAVSPNAPGSPVNQPSGDTLPFSPYYFPYVVRNADGSLTGYFDWRPKDGDEATVVAKSTDGGLTWTSEGEALEQNQAYCPSGDTNDDGEGHPFVANLGSSGPQLYTLQRAAGDNAGVGLLAHSANPSASNPLASVPSQESVGVDPNTFATSATTVPATGGTGVTIPVSTLGGDAGSGNSTSITDSLGNSIKVPDVNAIAAGQFVDVTAEKTLGLTQDQATITCTATSGSTGNSPALTGCVNGTTTTHPLTESGFNVGADDDLIQAIGTISSVVVDSDSPSTSSTTIPYAANPNVAGTSGPAGGVNIKQNDGVDISFTSGSGSANSPTTLYTINANAPDRFYVDGSTVYCIQANADPTTKIENCTTTNPNGVTWTAGDPVVADPTDPAAATTGAPVTQTDGLLAPDGIIGPLPSSDNGAWGAPSNSTVVLYTEKLLNYFNIGGVNGTITAADATATTTSTVALPGSTPTDYNISPLPSQSEHLPASGPFSVYVVANGATTFTTLTCTGWNVDTNTHNADRYTSVNGTIDLIGCTSGSSTGTIAAGHQGQWIAGPGAAIEPLSVLSQIGEGKSNQEKLLGNNEDYEVVRAAYTTDGVNFTDLGAISGSSSGSGATSGGYTDITNPFQQDAPAGPSTASLDAGNPQGDAPASLPQGTADSVELRWPGSRGTLITNADGSLGLFLSGAWPSDGDSDAFNQIFYTQSSDGGKTWSVPEVVQSTDYTFAASVAQDQALAAGNMPALGVSAYYSGRAYDPTVVQNPDGTVTLVFAGYRLPNPAKAAGTEVGTNSSAQYDEETTLSSGAVQTDPALYRNILTETLWPQQAPTVTTTPASAVTTGSANLNGTVQTFESNTAVTVEWGTSPTSLTNTITAGTLSGAVGAQPVSASLEGLTAGTTYYYELSATNADGTANGAIQSFTTATPAPPAGNTSTTPTQTSTSTTTPTSTSTPTSGTPSSAGSVGTPTGQTTAKTVTVTIRVGDQRIYITVPRSTGQGVAPTKKLSVKYRTAVIAHATPHLAFLRAYVRITGSDKIIVTLHKTTDDFSVRMTSKGVHWISIQTVFRELVETRDRAGKKVAAYKQVDKTLRARVTIS